MIRLPVSREDEWKDSSGCLLLLRASFRRNILHSVDCTFTKKTFFVVHKMSRYTWSKNKKQRQCQTCRRSFFVLLKLLHGYTLLFVTAGILTSGLTPSFIRSMRTGPRHWRARGHREITWSFTKVFFKFPKCFVSRLFQFSFSSYGFLTDVCDDTCELIQPRVWLNVLLLCSSPRLSCAAIHSHIVLPHIFSLALNPLRTFRMTKKASHWFSEHLMTFLKTTEHFSGKLWTLRWRILVGKQKHNVQKHIQNTIKRTQKYKWTNHFYRTWYSPARCVWTGNEPDRDLHCATDWA